MSDINTNKIDRNFPEPGRDNDSFGFRNNFSEISDNLDITKTEIEDLQENVVRTDSTADFNSNTVQDLNLKNATTAVYDIGNVSEDVDINVQNGQYQKLVAADNLTITLSGWAGEDKATSVLIEISKTSTEDTVISFDQLFNQTIKYDPNFPETLTITDDRQNVFVEFTSADEGETLYARYHGIYTAQFDNQIENPFVTRNIIATKNVTVQGDLTVDGVINFPDLELPADLDSLNDVDIDSGVSNNQLLKFNDSTAQWENVDDPILKDLDIDSLENDQLLRYNSAAAKWQNVNDPLSNVEIDGSLSDKQILRYNSTTNTWQNVDDPLENVSIDSVADNQILQYVGSEQEWQNVDAPLITKVSLTSLSDEEILRYDSSIDRWINTELKFQNVDTTTVTDKQTLRYNAVTGQWETKDFGKLVEIEITVELNGGTGNQEFRLDGQFLEDAEFFFQVGTIYRFDLSDSSNENFPLRFSTTADSDTPSSTTDYATDVEIVGVAGTSGAYIEIKITETSPDILYFYGEPTDPLIDTSLVGKGEDGAIDVGVRRQTAVFNNVKSDILVSNGDKVIDYENNVVQGNHSPAEFIAPVVTTVERDELGGGTPFIGQLVFNTDEDANGALQIYVGGGVGWQTLAYVV